MTHLIRDIGWPALGICLLTLALITPGLIAYAKFEIRLARRARRWNRVNTLTDFGAIPTPVTAPTAGATASTATTPHAVEAHPVVAANTWLLDQIAEAMTPSSQRRRTPPALQEGHLMGVRIIADHDGAVLYCSTSMWAFGPVFDDHEQAEDFCDWFTNGHAISAAILDGHCRIPELNGRTENDPRGYDLETLGRLHDIWVKQRQVAV